MDWLTGLLDPSNYVDAASGGGFDWSSLLNDPSFNPSDFVSMDPGLNFDPTQLIGGGSIADILGNYGSGGSDPFSGMGTPDMTGGGGFNLGSLLSGLGGGQGLLGGLLGALGPVAGMFAPGARQNTTTFGNQGQNTTQTPLMDPASRYAGGQAQGGLQTMGQYAPGLYGQGAGLLGGPGAALALGMNPAQMAQGGLLGALGGYLGQGPPGAPGIMGLPGAPQLGGLPGAPGLTAAGMGGLPSSPGLVSPDKVDMAGMQELVRKAYDPMVAGIADQAIEAARNAGFAGGADLLGGAASPLAAKALQNVPGQEAGSLLQLMQTLPLNNAQIAQMMNQAIVGKYGADVSAYGAQANAANAYNNALANIFGTQMQGALGQNQTLANLYNTGVQGTIGQNNALTNQYGTQLGGINNWMNALMGGAGQYGNMAGQQGQFLGQFTGQMMDPLRQFIQGQTQLMGQYPYGSQTNFTGQTQNRGTQANVNNPLSDIPNVIGGFAQGVNSIQQQQQNQAFQQMLARALGGGLSGTMGG